MIETLNGVYETVVCKQSTSLKLYDNDEYEDYPPHWHNALEIILPLENIYTLSFGEHTEVLQEGDIIIICPGCVHSIQAPPTGRRIIFQPNCSHLRFMRDVEVLISVMSPYTVIRPCEYPAIYPRLRELLLEIRNEYMEGSSFMEMSIYSKILLMFSLIGKNHADNAKGSMKEGIDGQEEYLEKFMEVCDYINLHCSEDLKLDEVADMSGFSKYYFERRFKNYTGTSFYKYVNQKRIIKAEQLLISPGNSVTDVALNCGFSSMSSFIRMFKQLKGCTPTEFKNMYWNNDHTKMEDEGEC